MPADVVRGNWLPGSCRGRLETGFSLAADAVGKAEPPPGLGVVPIGGKDLRGAAGGAPRGPGKPAAVGRKSRQTVEAVRVSDADRIVPAFRIHDVELEVGKALRIGGEQDVIAGRMEKGRPRHGAQAGDPFWLRTVGVHGEDFRRRAVFRETPPNDLFAVGAEKRAAVVAGGGGQTAPVRAVGVHDVNHYCPVKVQV